MTARAEKLPSYKNPPVDEVAVGIQFQDIEGFTLVYGPFYERVRSDFPQVEEQDPLEVKFETFGSPMDNVPTVTLSSKPGRRLWCLSEDGHRLVQLQPNRLIQNWRKISGRGEYPRFHAVLAEFWNSFDALDAALREVGREAVHVNQCEVTYFNNIFAVGEEDYPQIFDRAFGWPCFKKFDTRLAAHRLEPEVAAAHFQMRLIDEKAGEPRGRLTVSAGPALDLSTGQKIIRLQLMVRGIPSSGSREDVAEFLMSSREAIVKVFTDMTSEQCHTAWERER